MSHPLRFRPGSVSDNEDVGVHVGGIAGRISSAITLGQLSPGERLPAEPELAQQFGVAIATLRKALAQLREQGLVETRRGRNGGTFVVRAPQTSLDEMKAQLARTSLVSLRDFADEHAAIASACAHYAAERTPTGATTRLAELAFRARDAVSQTERATADSRFHIEIAVLSQSTRLLKAEQRLQNEITPILWADKLTRSSPKRAFTEHLALAAAIEQSSSTDAASIAIKHVKMNVREVIDTKLRISTPNLTLDRPETA